MLCKWLHCIEKSPSIANILVISTKPPPMCSLSSPLSNKSNAIFLAPLLVEWSYLCMLFMLTQVCPRGAGQFKNEEQSNKPSWRENCARKIKFDSDDGGEDDTNKGVCSVKVFHTFGTLDEFADGDSLFNRDLPDVGMCCVSSVLYTKVVP